MALVDVRGNPVSRNGLRRTLLYCAISAWLYGLAIATIWLETGFGVIETRVAIALSVLFAAGSIPPYLIIRFVPKIRVATDNLAMTQAVHGIICIAVSYACFSSTRSVAVLPLPMIILLCAFSVTRRAAIFLAVFSVLALGMAILWKEITHPKEYSVLIEIVHLFAIANILGVTLFLTEQFNALRRRLLSQQIELVEALATTKELGLRDDLTKLPNRRHMNALLFSEEKRHASANMPMSIALLDIDFFKRVNDTYGHTAGDETLCRFAEVMRASMRSGDVVARWGGEEFLLLMPNTDQATARLAVQRLQGCLADYVERQSADVPRITFSAGIALLLPGEPISEAINKADRAMFQAKGAGRNAVR